MGSIEKLLKLILLSLEIFLDITSIIKSNYSPILNLQIL